MYFLDVNISNQPFIFFVSQYQFHVTKENLSRGLDFWNERPPPIVGNEKTVRRLY